MLQPETVRAFGEGLKTAWASVGPLVGVIIGAMLTRAWDRRKWINENRKQEYRELLTTLTNACTALIDNAQALVQSPAEQILAKDEHFKSLRVLQDRIFIANEISKMNLFDRWGVAIKDLQETRGLSKIRGQLRDNEKRDCETGHERLRNHETRIENAYECIVGFGREKSASRAFRMAQRVGHIYSCVERGDSVVPLYAERFSI